MIKKLSMCLLVIILVANMCDANPTAPEGFVVEKIMERLDGKKSRLEAIRNSDYGSGVIAASVDNGILTVLKINQSSIEALGTRSGYPTNSTVRTVRFDGSGIFNNKLFISVCYDTDGDVHHEKTEILKNEPDGTVSLVQSIGSSSDEISMLFDFTSGDGGYQPGAYLEDLLLTDGTSLYHMDYSFTLTKLKQNHVPSGRTDLDVYGIQFDPTGLYGNYLTMVDSDTNNDNWAVIYQLLPDLTWKELAPKVRPSVRVYRDMCFSESGIFGEMLYITDTVSNSVMTVAPDGTHETFVSGFNSVESVTVDDSGEFMYVSDNDGVWRVKGVTTEIGPRLVMQEPKVTSEGVFTDTNGINSVRFLWNEQIEFVKGDIEILNEDEEPVSFSASGSNSNFMIISFGEALMNDIYTITIEDSVTSVNSGYPIDGDGDGLAGGNAIIAMEHRQRHDSDNDNDIDLYDLAEFAEKWLWQE